MHDDQLEHAAAALAEEGIAAELVPAIGDPAGAIVSLAEEHKADLVVIGTREPHLVERLMRHSVSRDVAHTVRRDLLIVHPEH